MWRHSCVFGGGAHGNRVGYFSPRDFCSVAGFGWLFGRRSVGLFLDLEYDNSPQYH